MTTVQSLKDRVDRILTFLSNKEQNIRDYRTQIASPTVVSVADQPAQEAELRDINSEIDSYKTKFEEEESRLQALGGKTRKQTLQEFVLLFFWISYAVFTVSAGLYTYRTAGSSAAQKMVGILVLVALVITAILIRYA